MNESAIENALKAVLGNASLGVPINWPNRGYSSDKPRIDVTFAGGERNDRTLVGTDAERSAGVMSCAVVSKRGIATTSANALANSIADLFPSGSIIAATGVRITITKPPTIAKGFPDSLDAGKFTEWRTPVVVEYEALATS